MSVRINFEIGHEASIRSKRTVDGFTHDWEVFVRGCDKADIHYFIDKVVFHLHETFPNPKRVIKEPPYNVRESGYAGFNLPIDIYLRTNEEPKKIRFTYDLNLQPTGPAICKVQKEKYVFHNPSDEFRHKLVKGGGYVTNSDPARDISSSTDKLQLLNKAKSASTSEPLKKHRTKEHKQEDSFTNLFGTPITKTTKVSPDAKMPSKTSPTNVMPTKPDKSANPKKSKSKHSPKDKDRDKEKKDKSQEKKHKEEKKNKDRSKDKERKDKSLKRERSPMQQPSVSPARSPKRPPSPKRMPSPKRPPSPPVKVKFDEKKSDELSKEKMKADSKRSKHEQKDKEKDKEKKEHKSHKDKEAASRNAEPQQKAEHKILKEPKPPKEQQLPYKTKEKSAKPPEETVTREPEKVDKQKVDKPLEPEKQKHKHKKKDSKEKREKKEEKSREKKADKKAEKSDCFFEKVYKDEVKESPKDLDKNSVSSKLVDNSVLEKNSARDKSRGLSALQAELIDDTSSSSVVTHDESSIEVPAKPQPPPLPPPAPPATSAVVEKLEPSKKSKDRGKTDQSPDKKRKRKHESNGKEEAQVKVNDEPSPKITRDEPEYIPLPSSDNSNIKKETISSSAGAAAATGAATDVSQDYMSILKELQHKIMTLQDNDELQRVVQLIAETGQFEITAQTFDFDLCALDRDTVRRLQEFFALS